MLVSKFNFRKHFPTQAHRDHTRLCGVINVLKSPPRLTEIIPVSIKEVLVLLDIRKKQLILQQRHRNLREERRMKNEEDDVHGNTDSSSNSLGKDAFSDIERSLIAERNELREEKRAAMLNLFKVGVLDLTCIFFVLRHMSEGEVIKNEYCLPEVLMCYLCYLLRGFLLFT
jgi:hypothetical protein